MGILEGPVSACYYKDMKKKLAHYEKKEKVTAVM